MTLKRTLICNDCNTSIDPDVVNGPELAAWSFLHRVDTTTWGADKKTFEIRVLGRLDTTWWMDLAGMHACPACTEQRLAKENAK